MQYLVLESGGCREAFAAQKECLRRLVEFVEMKAGSALEEKEIVRIGMELANGPAEWGRR